jgi:small-conductance mechanosensitive channel
MRPLCAELEKGRLGSVGAGSTVASGARALSRRIRLLAPLRRRSDNARMNDLKLGERDLLSYVKPDTLLGALIYLALFVVLALLLSRALRTAVHAAMTRKGNIDRTTISFLQQMGTAMIWVIVIILYAHLIPALRSMGTALLAGASVASVVIGLAAQSTLGNLVAGIAITIYRPFRLGDTLQVATPTGTDIGTVELISLGYTTLRAPAGHLIVLPNAIAASQVTLNLSGNFAPWPLAVSLRLSRDVDLEQARTLALQVARENAGQNGVVGCFLIKVDAASVSLELRMVAPDAAARDALRSKVIDELAGRFARQHLGTNGSELPAFA